MAAKQGRNFSVLLYLDTSDYEIDKIFSGLDNVFDRWAYALHDFDLFVASDPVVLSGERVAGEVKKDHVHLVGSVKDPRTCQTIANKLGISERFVQFSKGSFRKAVRYLIHLDDEDKYQYDKDVIVSNFDHSVYLDKMSDVQKAIAIYDYIEKGCPSFRDALKWSMENGYWSEFRRGYAIWKDLYYSNSKHLMNNDFNKK